MDCHTEDSLVNFNTTWAEYEKGFGDLHTEFWYGLEEVHFLTKKRQWEMRVDYKYTAYTWNYVHYNNFSVGSVSEEYPLTVGGYTGDDMNWFNINKDYNKPLNGMKFSIQDSCAVSYMQVDGGTMAAPTTLISTVDHLLYLIIFIVSDHYSSVR